MVFVRSTRQQVAAANGQTNCMVPAKLDPLDQTPFRKRKGVSVSSPVVVACPFQSPRSFFNESFAFTSRASPSVTGTNSRFAMSKYSQ